MTEENGKHSGWVEGLIRDFWACSETNTLGESCPEKAWDEPIVGYSRGSDPFYVQIKNDLGPFFWTPQEAFALAFPESAVPAEDLTVITWVLPQTEATRTEQRRETLYASGRWARARFHGERFNVALRQYLARTLTENGFAAAAPERLPEFGYRRSERFGLASNWSERHAAFVAGLGTFGLSDGLITPRGKAVRVGSVVARIAIAPSPRPYEHHQQWCLWHAKQVCGVCMRRCPAGAITEKGHDKDRCHDYIRQVTAPHARQSYGVEATPCGLCQVAVPCEARNPVRT